MDFHGEIPIFDGETHLLQYFGPFPTTFISEDHGVLV